MDIQGKVTPAISQRGVFADVLIVGLLSQPGHDVDTVPNEGLAGKDDGEVWTVTQAVGRFLITHGLDFSDERKYAPGTHKTRHVATTRLLSHAAVRSEGAVRLTASLLRLVRLDGVRYELADDSVWERVVRNVDAEVFESARLPQSSEVQLHDLSRSLIV